MSERQKPGQRAVRSGQYEVVGPRGGRTGEERTVVRGEPLPPTPEEVKGISWLIQRKMVQEENKAVND